MSEFQRHSIGQNAISPDDHGVSVQDVIELAQSNRFFGDLSNLLNLSDIASEFIEIKGAGSLVQSLKQEDKKFAKFDLESDYHDLDFFYGRDDNEFYISFTNIKNQAVLAIVQNTEFTCTTKYSSKSDFFNSVHSMQNFASSLIEDGHKDFVKNVLYRVKDLYTKGEHEKYYRILLDKDGKYYLRASVSERYNDYSNNIAVLLGLVGLHNQSKRTGEKFKVQEFSYNESFVKVSFVKESNRYIEGVGDVKYVIEVSNDEIKREALKFTSAVSIIYGKNDEEKGELYIKPDEVKWTLLSISHGSTPKTVIKKLADLENYIEKEEEIYKNLESISKIRNTTAVKQVIFSRIDNSRNIKNGARKQEMLAELNANVDNVYDLFKILNKVQHLTEDVEAKDFLRYLFYEILVRERPDRENGNEKDI